MAYSRCGLESAADPFIQVSISVHGCQRRACESKGLVSMYQFLGAVGGAKHNSLLYAALGVRPRRAPPKVTFKLK